MNAVSGQNGFLLHVYDNYRKERWLVDGGALLSIIPPTDSQKRAGPNDTELRAANGTPISCYGTETRTIQIGNQDFTFNFIIADVSQRILGADFLAENYLAPNHRDGVLLNLNNFDTLPATLASGISSNPINFVDQLENPYYKLLDSHPKILTPSFTIKQPDHGVKHHIPTEGPPCQSRPRRLAPDRLAIAKEEIDKLVKLGVCYRGKSEWASPLMVAPKPGGGWRVCGDYRRLNSMTKDDKYPVRTLSDFTSELHGKKIFSKIDLIKGYHQVPVADEDIRKTAVITPFGLFIFPRTPFGLKNAGQDFQRLMDQIFGSIPFVFVYIDDILVASESPEQHLKDLEVVFNLLEENGLVVQRPKCILGQPSLEFLGYTLDATGITPLETRVETIRQTKPPTTIKELQRFLGMVNYYRRFIPKAANHLYGLFECLKGKPKMLEWTSTCQESFDAIKTALANATLLHHPRTNANLALTTDASDHAIGAVLEQRGPRGWEPLAFYSSKLNESQQKWPPYDRELLGVFKSVRHFKSMLEGRTFTIYTDHQSLVPSLSKKTEPQTSRQAYQLSCIAEFSTDIRHIEGKSNVVADSLSRPPAESPAAINVIEPIVDESPNSSSASSIAATDSNAVHRDTSQQKLTEATCNLIGVVSTIQKMGINWEDLADEQLIDADCRRIRADRDTPLNLKHIDIGQKNILVDISNGPARPIVPFSWRKKLFDVIHGLGHPGVERTRQSMTDKFVWPSIKEDVSKWARECQHCQLAKITRHTVPQIGDFPVPPRRFDHINLDIVGPLPASNGFRYLLTAVDRFTRWPVAIPMTDITSESVIDAFSHGWVATFGIPSTITTDRGSQFGSAIWKQLTTVWGIETRQTTAYHPESNGLVERFHRRLKESLIALADGVSTNWFWRLPCTLLAIRTTLKPDIGSSPADLVFGEGIAVPGELLYSKIPTDEQLQRQRTATLADLRLEVARLQPTETSAHRRPNIYIPESLQDCTHVFVRRGGVQSSLSSPYIGPYRVVSRDNQNFKLSIPGKGNESVAISRLKPAIISDDEDPDPPTPPRPGRRPGIRTRIPDATTRVTRAESRRLNPPSLADDEIDLEIQIPTTSNNPDPPPPTSAESIPELPLPTAPDNVQPAVTSEPEVDRQPVEQQTPHPKRFFSTPNPKNFSYRRRPDVSALAELLRNNIAINSSNNT